LEVFFEVFSETLLDFFPGAPPLALDFSAFINEYFIYPMRYPASYLPYNIFNTAAFAVAALLSAWLLRKIIAKKLRIPIDENFYFAVFPYLLFGGFFRVAEDAKILPRETVIGGYSFFPFITPGIYLISFLLICAFLAASHRLSKRENFLGNFKKAGWALAACAALYISISVGKFPNYLLGISIVALAAACAIAFKIIDRAASKSAAKPSELATVFSQSLDGAATFAGLQFAGYTEQHVLGNMVIGSFGPFSFFLLKAAFAWAVVWVARREFGASEADRQLKTYFLLLITIFGIGPGTRDFFRIALGV
jgi:uncharacterized membrane protein